MMTEHHQTMCVNLPVRDLQRSVAFFGRLGFRFDPRFTDSNATCMIVNDRAYVMLLVRPFFATFTSRPLADPEEVTGGLYAFSLGSRAEVDALMDGVAAAGGRTLDRKDLGFMYQGTFLDPDGHQWEPFHMDMAAFEASSQAR